MLELDLEIHKESFELEDSICQFFTQPIILYLWNKYDLRNFFTTFVIMDFQKKEFTYYISFSKENKKKVDGYHREKFLNTGATHGPHSTLKLPNSQCFYNFIENGKYFFFVNPEKRKIQVFTGEDLRCSEGKEIRSFGSTFYWTDESSQYFYFTAHTNISQEGNVIHYYKTDASLKGCDLVFM